MLFKILIIVASVISMIIILFFIIKKIGNSPYIHKRLKIENMKKYLNILLRRGYSGGFMVISCYEKKNLFLQFKKFISNDESVFLELGFPLAKWSKNFYDSFHNLLAEKKIEYRIENETDDNPLEFTLVNCGTNLELCVDLIKETFIKIFKCSEENLMFKVYFVHCSPEDEVIGIID